MTDFGSLLVNGLEVELDRATRVSDAFGPLDAGRLRLGQALTIEAQRVGGALVAQTVRFSRPLVGKVAGALRPGAAFSVNGTDVWTEAGAIGQAVRGALVAVSGACVTIMWWPRASTPPRRCRVPAWRVICRTMATAAAEDRHDAVAVRRYRRAAAAQIHDRHRAA